MGGVGVGAGGVEGVGVAHGVLGKGGEVLGLDGLLELDHVVAGDLGYPVLEEVRGVDGQLHARGGRDVLLGGADDEDEGAQVPVVGLGDELGEGVAAVGGAAHPPGDVAAEHAPAGGAGALSGNLGQLRGRVGQLVEVGDGADEGGEAGGRRGETGGRGEVVLRGDLQLELGQLGKGAVLGLETGALAAELAEAVLGPLAVEVGELAIEVELVLGVGARGRGRGAGLEVVLGQGRRERGVRREVELGVSLTPVPVERENKPRLAYKN